MIVAIDGPAGAGKSTVAKRAAAALGFTYIDTGAMYRAVAWAALRQGIAPDDGTALADLAAHLHISLAPLTPEGTQAVLVDGEEVTGEIRTPQVSGLTSAISALPPVRRVLVAQQQRMGREDPCGVVLDGRDIGTVVFPNAAVKIFLTASAEERARRRCEELQARGMQADFESVFQEQIERDTRDSLRKDSPLAVAPDAVLLHTDGLTIDAVVAQILALCQAALAAEDGP